MLSLLIALLAVFAIIWLVERLPGGLGVVR